jgi:YhcH/YjgK/YiaL family protein
MIISNITSLVKYHSLGDGLTKALKFITSNNFKDIKKGRYDLEGEDLFYIIDSYSTKLESGCKLECHKKYIDVHYVVSGTEMIGYAPHTSQTLYKKYDALHDYALYDGEVSFINLRSDNIAIFYPEDLHMTGIGDGKQDVKKIVVKVKI